MFGENSGNEFLVLWNPNAGYTESAADQIYPGDDVVDWIGLDTYDSDYNGAAVTYNLGLSQVL